MLPHHPHHRRRRPSSAALLAVSAMLLGCGEAAGDGGAPEAEPLTGFPGDELALPVPAEGEGLQLHYGPADYDDPDAVAPFVLEPGEELVDCTYAVLPNPEALYYSGYQVASRPSMHHVILYTTNGEIDPLLHDNCGQRKAQPSAAIAVLDGGIEGQVLESPPSDEQAVPENAGLAGKLRPEQAVAYEMHAINVTDEPLLRESWTNVELMSEQDVASVTGQLFFNGGLAMKVPPATRTVVQNACVLGKDVVAAEEVRIIDIFGHMHAHGRRFSAWLRQQDPARPDDLDAATHTLIYESYEWGELERRAFNSVRQNPAPEYGSGRSGGYSGLLTLRRGDALVWECEIDNDLSTQIEFGVQAFEAEMCNLFGTFSPTQDGEPWLCISF